MRLLIGLHVIYLLTLALAALIGWFLYKRIPYGCRPFIFFLLAETVFELLKFIGGAYPELESWLPVLQSVTGTLLLCRQVHNWKVFTTNKVLYTGIILFALTMGIVGMLTINSDFPFWLAISPAIIRVAIGIVLIRFSLINEAGTSLQKPMLSIGTGLFVFYTFSTLLVVLTRMGDINDQDFLAKAYLLYIPFGIIANLLFARAVLRMPVEKGMRLV